MPTSLLGNDEFLAELSKLFSSKTDHGSVFLTQKRYSYKPEVPPSKSKGDDLSDLKTKETFPLLVRASDGDKLKISTVVQQDELVSFFGKYGEVCKNGMQGLKKRDRKKEKAKKEKKKVEKK